MRDQKTAVETWNALGLRAWQGHPALMDYSHRHNELELNLVSHGSVTYFFGGRRFEVQAGTLVLFWAIAPHQLIESADETQMYWLTLPLAWFLHQRWPEPFRRAVLNARLVYDQKLTAQDPLLFGQWQKDLESGATERREIVYLEVEARLRRMALNAPGAEETSETGAGPGAGHSQSKSMAEIMAAYLADHFLEEVNVERVASMVGLHPNYAMNVFRKSYGQTIVEYLTQCRIAYAQQMLVTTGQNVVQIAMESGFGSISQFYAAFKKQCGMSPRAYRESLQ